MLFLPHQDDNRAEVWEDAPTRLCKSCYALVLRVKKNDDNVGAKKESLKERLVKSMSFFFGRKHQRQPSSPMPLRIPTPSRSPALKRCSMEQGQRTSARRLTFAQPIESTSDLAEEFSFARPPTKDFPQEPRARNRTACTASPNVNNFERSIVPSFDHRSS